MTTISFKMLALLTALLTAFAVSSADAQTKKKVETRKLCVNGNSLVFARTKCLTNEKTFAIAPATTPTPTPTPSVTAPLDLDTCRKVTATASANVGVATASISCDVNSEFILSYGYGISNDFNSEASVRDQQLLYVNGVAVPVGATVTMEGSRTRFYNLNLTGTCCSRD